MTIAVIDQTSHITILQTAIAILIVIASVAYAIYRVVVLIRHNDGGNDCCSCRNCSNKRKA